MSYAILAGMLIILVATIYNSVMFTFFRSDITAKLDRIVNFYNTNRALDMDRVKQLETMLYEMLVIPTKRQDNQDAT